MQLATTMEAFSSSDFFSSHPLVVLYNVIWVVSLPMMYLNEKKSAMPYSKFAAFAQKEKDEKMIPSKEGMLIIYVPALIAGLVYVCLSYSGITPQFEINIPAFMVVLHFLKRTLEVLYLHKYSGKTVLTIAVLRAFP